MHTTNYADTFIAVAEDCPAEAGAAPPERAEPTVARMQYDLLREHPYRYTSDELLFEIHARRRGIAPEAREAARAEFFSRGQACLRSSPLAKRYGWGLHHDGDSRVAIVPRESEAYARLSVDPDLKQVRAMRGAR